ncbi:MAG: Mov34/MPN/PAD-1 family protein [Planctomycetes bacterium]|nr:Mov34/MPN/PAD-1 family protein [Planctomycetota bacterium]
MRPARVRLAASAWQPIAANTAAAWPREMVAVLGGRREGEAAVVEAIVALTGAGGTRGFAADPVRFLAAEASLRAAGWAWLGFVHSHPGGTAAPSALDRATLWRGCIQLVVGGVDPTRLQVGAYWLDESVPHPLPLAGAAGAA